jgi:hypothetical protein
MEQYYMPSTATILSDVASLVSNYGTTTSDHYPVFTRYRFGNPTSQPTVTVCPTVTANCANSNGTYTYTIPAFTAIPTCGGIKYSYTITGATQRSGTTNDASGSFAAGTSTINWTATDDYGNTASCQTLVVVNSNPVVSIPDVMVLPSGVLPNTVYKGYSPAASATLSASVTGGTPGYTYNWSTGASGASAIVSPAVNTTYSLTVTDANGCQASASKAIAVTDVRAGKKLDKVAVCHKNNNTLEIGAGGVSDHLAHGDMLGKCKAYQYAAAATGSAIERDGLSNRLSVTASPNPTTGYFIIAIKGNGSNEKVRLKVIDLLGRVVEGIDHLSQNQNIRLGANYRPGSYFAEVMQGKEKVVIQLSKK